MNGITSVNTLSTLFRRLEVFSASVCSPVCMQIAHVQTSSSQSEVELHVIRGSIGLADGAGTPLKQGQDIPLTGAMRQEEGGWR